MSVLPRARARPRSTSGCSSGAARAGDGRHELVSVMQSISLADELTLEHGAPGDHRRRGRLSGRPGPGRGEPRRRALRCVSREPPAGRLRRCACACTSASRSPPAWAAAPPTRPPSLRLAAHASGLGDRAAAARARRRARGGRARPDLRPGRWLATGAGEQLHELPARRPPLGAARAAAAAGLSTARVYAEADRLGPRAHAARELEQRRAELSGRARARGAALPAPAELLHNDLQRAAVSLCPEIARRARAARARGRADGARERVGAHGGGRCSRGPQRSRALERACELAGRAPRAGARRARAHAPICASAAWTPPFGAGRPRRGATAACATIRADSR